MLIHYNKEFSWDNIFNSFQSFTVLPLILDPLLLVHRLIARNAKLIKVRVCIFTLSFILPGNQRRFIQAQADPKLFKDDHGIKVIFTCVINAVMTSGMIR